MSYEVIKELYENDPGVRGTTMGCFRWFDSGDPVKALKDLANIEFIIRKKLER